MITFSAISSDMAASPSGPMATGWAAPMAVFGAMAATCPDIVMNTPAEAALAPEGETNTTIGISALTISWIMSRMAVSRPPGVSNSMMQATAPSCSAWLIPRSM